LHTALSAGGAGLLTPDALSQIDKRFLRQVVSISLTFDPNCAAAIHGSLTVDPLKPFGSPLFNK
jgi:hypothetical protein